MLVEIKKLKGGAIESNSITTTQIDSAISPADRVLKAGDTMTGQLNIASGGLNIETTTTIQQTREKVNVSATALSANLFINLLDGAVTFLTANSTANSTVNFRGNDAVTLDTVLSSNQSMSSVIMVTNGATPYTIANVQIDGTTVTPRWANGTVPTANANSVDIFAFTMVKTAANTYSVFGSKTVFT